MSEGRKVLNFPTPITCPASGPQTGHSLSTEHAEGPSARLCSLIPPPQAVNAIFSEHLFHPGNSCSSASVLAPCLRIQLRPLSLVLKTPTTWSQPILAITARTHRFSVLARWVPSSPMRVLHFCWSNVNTARCPLSSTHVWILPSRRTKLLLCLCSLLHPSPHEALATLKSTPRILLGSILTWLLIIIATCTCPNFPTKLGSREGSNCRHSILAASTGTSPAHLL